MIKLSDIIKSGGGNAKINRFINRYVLSKKEKKDIINEIKEGGGSSSINENKKYFKAIKDLKKVSDVHPFINPRLSDRYGEYPIKSPTYAIVDGPTTVYLYYIDFNSDLFTADNNVVIQYNDYPHNLAKKAYKDLDLDEETVQAYSGTVKEIFEEYFIEVTKEEYLQIQKECINGTYVPEWEK